MSSVAKSRVASTELEAFEREHADVLKEWKRLIQSSEDAVLSAKQREEELERIARQGSEVAVESRNNNPVTLSPKRTKAADENEGKDGKEKLLRSPPGKQVPLSTPSKPLKITPHLWFDKQAIEAAEFYVSVFPNSRIVRMNTLHDTPSNDCDLVAFELSGLEFMAISAGPLFKFNEAISMVVHCETQDEIDYYWGKLSAVPEAERCGWLKDKFGLSWQIVPSVMGELLGSQDPNVVGRVTKAFLRMKKFDIKTLMEAAKS